MASSIGTKKSNLLKKLLFILVVLLGFLTLITSISFSTEIEVESTKIEAYQVTNIVNNAFTDNGIKYLPIIYKTADDELTKDYIESEFKSAGLTIKRISSNIMGTGTQIETDNMTYTILIYGDVNGDGLINVRDVQKIVKHILYEDELPKVNKMAANVYDEKVDEINVRDAQRIVQFILGRKHIIDTVPTPDVNENKEISSIKYKDINSTPSNYCYEDIFVATITSGDNQRKFIESDLKNIGCIITKGGEDSKYITEYTSDVEELGISKEIDSTGAVKISFWAKEEDSYNVIPYIMINGVRKEVDANPVRVTVSENNIINKITFEDTDNKEYFGQIVAGTSDKKTIDFYHEYEKAIEKIGKHDERPYSITRNMISLEYDSQIISNIELGYVDSNGRYIFDNNDDDYITVAKVTIASGVTVNEAEFTITVDNGKPQKFKVKIAEEQIIDNLKIGDDKQDTIKIYLNEPTNSEEDSKYDVVEVEGKYYTILPITFMRGETSVETILNANMLETSKTDNRKEDYLYAIDNVNEKGEDGSSIDILGFNWDEEKGKYIESTDETKINYIGIAFGYEKESAEYFFDESSDYYISEIKLYYNTFGTDGLVKTLNITSDYNPVNKITFGDMDNNEYFGEVTVDGSKTDTIKFYHNEDELVNVVRRNMISLEYDSQIISNIELGYVDSNGRYIFDNNDDDYITIAKVTIASGVTVNEAEFTITVDNGKPQKFKVKIAEEQIIDNLKIGDDEQDTIKIYLNEPTDSEEDSKYDVVEVEGKYYTILPITFMSGETSVETILNANMLETSKTDNRKEDYLYAIDNVNEKGEDGSSIDILGFNWDEEKGKYIESTDETKINYIGIAFGYEKESAEYFFDESSDYYISEIKLYYNTFGTDGLVKNFNVISDYENPTKSSLNNIYTVKQREERENRQIWFKIPEQFNA